MKTGIWILAVLVAGFAHAEDFSTRVVDALGKPVAGVSVRVEVLCDKPGDQVDVVVLGDFTTDANGAVKGSYKPAPSCKGGFVDVAFEKDGYAGYSDTQFKAEYVLRKAARGNDLARLASLHGEPQRSALRDLLVAEREQDGERALEDFLLQHTSKIHDAFLALMNDDHAGEPARHLISILALPEDMARMLPVVPRPSAAGAFDDRWIYGAVTGLVEPTTDTEWKLLEQAAFGDYDDGWVDYGAIQSLRLNASARSRAILAQVPKHNREREKTIQRALAYIDAGAKPVSDPDIAAAGAKAAKAVGLSGWRGNGEPRYSEDHQTGLIEARFIIDRDLLVYTATFHRVGNEWRLRAMRETMQALLAMDADEPPKK